MSINTSDRLIHTLMTIAVIVGYSYSFYLLFKEDYLTLAVLLFVSGVMHLFIVKDEYYG